MNERPLALIVDDEQDLSDLLEMALTRLQVNTRIAPSVSAARQLLARERFDLCLTDMKLPDGDGLDLVEIIQQEQPQLPVAVLTAYGSMETAIRALKSGAFDFVTKPIDINMLRKVVASALQTAESRSLPQTQPSDGRKLLGSSTAVTEIRAKITKLARSQAPIFISGESGTGKELVARLIHAHSARANKPFIAVNCGAIPLELMESEFFGYKKGSFTGATADKEGLFQAAEGGSLFLDEVADLPPLLQVKLLRAIQEKTIRPLGHAQEQPADVRILSATHKELSALVQQGQFRQDLYYRINVIELNIPPLRDRQEDVPLLIEHILQRLRADHGLVLAPRLTKRAMQKLCGYPFPGNVRELENILQRALALSDGVLIDADDLAMTEPPPRTAPTTPHLAATPTSSASEAATLAEYIDEVERQKITAALEKTRWNRTAAARELGITFRALRYRLKKLGLD